MSSPLDAGDEQILDELRELYTALDPVPPDLVACAQFAVDVAGPGFDVARIEISDPLAPAGTRGGQSRQIAFECGANLAILVHLQVHDDGLVRIDGWLAPPGEHDVELRTATGSTTADVSPQGRFVLEVRRGRVQFVVRSSGTTVATPTIVL